MRNAILHEGQQPRSRSVTPPRTYASALRGPFTKKVSSCAYQTLGQEGGNNGSRPGGYVISKDSGNANDVSQAVFTSEMRGRRVQGMLGQVDIYDRQTDRQTDRVYGRSLARFLYAHYARSIVWQK